jgi:histidinol-phosphate/aromatic aminotransferase/cobyric acid decarboxylase-like protein
VRVADTAAMIRWFEVRGVMLRDRSAHLANTVRITVGGAESMERLLNLLEEWATLKNETGPEALCKA